MTDSITVEQQTSWWSRIGNSFKGILIGLVIGCCGGGLLIWNEGNYVKQQKALDEGLRVVIELSDNCTVINPSYDSLLIHLVGTVESNDNVTDPTFGLSLNTSAMKLNRMVEMYQWTETQHTEEEKHNGGSSTTRTTYSYQKKWQSTHIDSSQFHEENHHTNPSTMLYQSESFVSTNVTMGAFSLTASPTLMDKITWFIPLEDYPFSLDAVSNDVRFPNSNNNNDSNDDDRYNSNKQSNHNRNSNNNNNVHVIGNGYYIGQNPQNPNIGDERITYESIQTPQTISIIGRQYMNTILQYTATNGGGTFLLIEPGIHEPKEMFEHAVGELQFFTWLLRIVGCVCIFIMFQSLTEPLIAFADVLPFVGNILAAGTSCINFLLTVIVGTTIIAIAWLVYRPILSLCLFGIGVVLLFMIHWMTSRKRMSSSYQKYETIPQNVTTAPTAPFETSTRLGKEYYPIVVNDSVEPIAVSYAFVVDQLQQQDEYDIPVATLVATPIEPPTASTVSASSSLPYYQTHTNNM